MSSSIQAKNISNLLSNIGWQNNQHDIPTNRHVILQ